MKYLKPAYCLILDEQQKIQHGMDNIDSKKLPKLIKILNILIVKLLEYNQILES